jgi:hypothetical protein
MGVQMMNHDGDSHGQNDHAMTWMKFIAVGGLGIVIGFVFGAMFLGPVVAPVEPFVENGRVYHVCGLQGACSLAVGGMAGAVGGLVVGLIVARFLPTPSERRWT